MPIKLLLLFCLVIVISPMPAFAERPILIAHRGASGDRPEHTLEAYRLAIEMGADFIEPDLVLSKDGVLVARHENEISGTTDVAQRNEFAARRATKTIDGQSVTGWFTEDFTFAELRTLKARERLPELRVANIAYDGQFLIPSFDEILALAQTEGQVRGRVIGVYPETKHPSYFTSIGLPHEAPLLVALAKYGLTKSGSPVFIQSFEVGNLRALRGKTQVRLIQLIASESGPADLPEMLYTEMITPDGLKAIAAYADGIGPFKDLVIARTADGHLGHPTQLVEQAHAVGLEVHPWTFRAENYFLPTGLKTSSDPREKGDLASEIKAFVAAGVDGIFSDHSAEARAALSD
ncbi:MAG: glycerophosphodiester phosphodiesterase [Sphingomonadaceae bacterium]|nr:glycerophosphodiester phosphodiesterase [Sphingomonadaceae bacterium]